MVAGPYSSGGGDATKRASSLRVLNEAALALHRLGHVPVIGVNMALPVIEAAGNDSAADDEVMMRLSLAERCDACLGIDGPSKGADAEVARFEAGGRPVFRSLDAVPGATRA